MAKLYYFDGRGRGEIIRLTLAVAGIEFTEGLSKTREQFLEWKDGGKLLFSQLPVLEIDGMVLCQTNSIVRYLGRKAGLCGKDEKEAALVDMYFEGGRDFFTPSLYMGFQPDEEVVKNCRENALPKYMPVFNKILEGSRSGYLVGSSLTLADVSLLEGLLVYVEYMGREIFKDFPALQKFYDKMIAEEKIAKYLNGTQRKIKNDERYIKEVMISLGRM